MWYLYVATPTNFFWNSVWFKFAIKISLKIYFADRSNHQMMITKSTLTSDVRRNDVVMVAIKVYHQLFVVRQFHVSKINQPIDNKMERWGGIKHLYIYVFFFFSPGKSKLIRKKVVKLQPTDDKCLLFWDKKIL